MPDEKVTANTETKSELDNLKAALAKKKLVVMAELERIKERGTNTDARYHYVLGADVIDVVRKAMVTAGISLEIPLQDELVGEHAAGRDGKWIVRHYKTIYRLVDSESGYYEETVKYSDAADSGDKSRNKNSTTSLKYFLARIFLVSWGDEIDDESGETNQGKGGGSKSKQKQPDYPKPGESMSKRGQKANTEKQKRIEMIKKTGCLPPVPEESHAIMEGIRDKFKKEVIDGYQWDDDKFIYNVFIEYGGFPQTKASAEEVIKKFVVTDFVKKIEA